MQDWKFYLVLLVMLAATCFIAGYIVLAWNAG